MRLLLDALRRVGALDGEINIAAWRGIEDKAVAGRGRLLRAALTLLAAYPAAMLKLLRAPRGGAVLLPYPGIPDVFFAAIAARLRGRRIVLDAFLPLHDTIVGDRAMLRPRSLPARLIWLAERIGLRLADIILVDTDQHGDFFAVEFGIDRSRFETVLVGAEPLFRAPAGPVPPLPAPAGRPLVLFYGQLIPLHGLETILEAARRTVDAPFHWLLVGRGQQEPLLRAALETKAMPNVSWLPWVDYAALPALIGHADLCLGIFGASAKAGRVIPNKMFQVLSAGKPIVTRASPAVAALAAEFPDTVITVPAADPVALAETVRRCLADPARLRPLPPAALDELGPDRGVASLLRRLSGG
ncbi:glycosyltransferase [Sphingomonas parva]|uniref:glycosyltransferase n=1 Tax=Sphingomonas parva TaxID=2555898 RepID=UPI001CDCF65E|nr:glycosyltransferase [Sphingomonas parva]